MKLYAELAGWWHLFSRPEDYAEEAAFVRNILKSRGTAPARSLVEFGSGGGNNASHLKSHFDLTLVEPAAGMRQMSEVLNPECAHIAGDMRTVRLGRTFDRVLIHDAIMYMTTEAQLRDAMTTAFVHCREGGASLFMPDFVRETFVSHTHRGGHDGDDRSIRYLEWAFDPYAADHVYDVHFAIMLRGPGEQFAVEHDHHVFGLFPRDTWLRLLEESGFRAQCLDDEPFGRDTFLGLK